MIVWSIIWSQIYFWSTSKVLKSSKEKKKEEKRQKKKTCYKKFDKIRDCVINCYVQLLISVLWWGKKIKIILPEIGCCDASVEYDADLCAHSLRSCASQSDACGSRAALFGRTLCCRTLFCDDDGAITLPLAASPGGELHLTFQPPNTAARVPRSRSERGKKKKKKLWWWDGVRGGWAHVTWDVAVNPPSLLFSWGTTRLRLCKQQHQKHCRLISLSRAELVRHQDAMLCQTAPPAGHQ